MTTKCDGCGGRCRAMGHFCRTCQTRIRRAAAHVLEFNCRVEMAGGSWWMWNAVGDIIAGPSDTKSKCLIDRAKRWA